MDESEKLLTSTELHEAYHAANKLLSENFRDPEVQRSLEEAIGRLWDLQKNAQIAQAKNAILRAKSVIEHNQELLEKLGATERKERKELRLPGDLQRRSRDGAN